MRMKMSAFYALHDDHLIAADALLSIADARAFFVSSLNHVARVEQTSSFRARSFPEGDAGRSVISLYGANDEKTIEWRAAGCSRSRSNIAICLVALFAAGIEPRQPSIPMQLRLPSRGKSKSRRRQGWSTPGACSFFPTGACWFPSGRAPAPDLEGWQTFTAILGRAGGSGGRSGWLARRSAGADLRPAASSTCRTVSRAGTAERHRVARAKLVLEGEAPARGREGHLPPGAGGGHRHHFGSRLFGRRTGSCSSRW